MAASRSCWDSLDDKAQEHVASFLGSNGSACMRAASSKCRLLANRQVKSFKLFRRRAGAVHTLSLPSRFPNLQKLQVSDFGWSQDPQPHFTRAELCHVVWAGQPWDKLVELDVTDCQEADALALCSFVKAVPNLQSLASRLRHNARTPAAIAGAVARLSKLQTLKLTADAEEPTFSLEKELLPLTKLQKLSSLTVKHTDWQLVAAVQQLVTLTSFVLSCTTGSSHGMLELLTSLTNLQHLELSSRPAVNCSQLGVVLASMSSLRSFTSYALNSSDGSAREEIASLTAATQLTHLELELYGDDHCLCPTFERCMQMMPNLSSLRLARLHGPLDAAALSGPAACAKTLKCLDLTLRCPHVATTLLSSAAFRSLKLAKLRLEFNLYFLREPEDMHKVLVEAVCSQVGLTQLALRNDFFDDEGLDWLDEIWEQVGKACSALQQLEIGGVWRLVGLGSIGNLQHLGLEGLHNIADVDLVHVAACQKLQSIKFHVCDTLTTDGVAALTLALPRLKRMEAVLCNFMDEWEDTTLARSDIEVLAR